MFVNENSVFRHNFIKLKISTLEGDCILIEVAPDVSVDSLKIESVGQLIDSSDTAKLSLYYNLLHTRFGRIVNEEHSLRQADIVDNDELLLICRRMPSAAAASHKKDEKQMSPVSAEDIASATAHLPSTNEERQQLEHAISIDFQVELKKILVSLIDVAQKLMCLNPAGYKEARKYVACDCASSARDVRRSVDPSALKQLVEMGFSQAKASKALLVNRMNQAQAIQWLCDNVDVVDEDDGTELNAKPAAVASTATASAACDATMTDDQLKQELVKLAQLPPSVKVSHMLASFKAYKRRVFEPDSYALQSLLEMGFDESDAVDALRTHNNVKDEACDWLLNHDKNCTKSADSDTVYEGLDPDSSVYKAIMSNDVIQLALINPRTLTALLHILENPSFIQQWLRDADLNPMLLQISRIYHTEKYRQ